MNKLNKALNDTIKKVGDDVIIKKAERISGKKLAQCPKCGHYFPKKNKENYIKFCTKNIK